MRLLRAAALACAVVAVSAGPARGDCVTFLDSDSNPAFSVDSDTHALIPSDQAADSFNRFECLKDDDLLPADLSFLARESAIRYAVLDLTPPAAWDARSVREVFRTRKDMILFLNRYFSTSKSK